MKACGLCLLALAAFTSAHPKPSGYEDREGWHEPHHPSKWHPEEYYKKMKHTSSVGGGRHGSPETTAFPSLTSVTGGFGGSGTGTGVHQRPAQTSSAGRKASNQDPPESGSSDKSDESNPGKSGSQSHALSPSSVVGTGPAATGTTSTSNTTSGGTISKGKITLPAGCESINGIGFGWIPDYNGASLKVDENAVGNKHPCFVGYYGQTGLSGWNNGAQITDNIPDAQSGGQPYPIFIASVQPQGTPFNQFTEGSEVVTSIASAMTKLTAAGFTVFLRFAHEMNWYDSAEGGNTYTGSTEDFSKAWGAVSDAVKSNPAVFMFWSPNYVSNAASDLASAGWYPSQGSVDIVGMDVYPKPGSSFASEYQNFCQQWPGIPFVIGETGADNGGSESDKHEWLQQLTSSSATSACPNYVGFSWFEYLKDGVDFRVATGGNTAFEGVL